MCHVHLLCSFFFPALISHMQDRHIKVHVLKGHIKEAAEGIVNTCGGSFLVALRLMVLFFLLSCPLSRFLARCSIMLCSKVGSPLSRTYNHAHNSTKQVNGPSTRSWPLASKVSWKVQPLLYWRVGSCSNTSLKSAQQGMLLHRGREEPGGCMLLC